MKKNISINLFGTLYAIDEDAYDLLERYLNSMKNYFAHQNGGDEIADDIEHRVAELLWQQKEAGAEAVNIDSVKEIIRTIGNPADIENDTNAESDATSPSNETSDSETDTNDTSANGTSSSTGAGASSFNAGTGESMFDKISKSVRSKRLYRDPLNKVLGGVCSGLAEYFGVGDPVFYRLAAVILTFVVPNAISALSCIPVFSGFALHFGMSFIVPIMYIIMLVIVPEAITPEDRLMMMGKDVTPDNLNEEILNTAEENEKRQQQASVYTPRQSSGNGCLKTGAIGCLAVIAAPFIFILGILLFVFIIVIIALGCVPFGLMSDNFETSDSNLQVLHDFIQNSNCVWLVWLGIICGLFVVVLPIYLLIRQMHSNRKRYSSATRTTLVVTWFAALAMCIMACVVCGSKFSSFADEWFEQKRIESMKQMDGFYYNIDDYDYFVNNGWRMIEAKNNEDGRFTYNGDYMTGDTDERYLDANVNNEDSVLRYTAEAKEFLEPGVYRLVANTRAGKDGAYIYAYCLEDKSQKKMYTPIIANSDDGGNIWMALADSIHKIDPIVREEVDKIKDNPIVLSDDNAYDDSDDYLDDEESDENTDRHGIKTVGEAILHAGYGHGLGWNYVYIDNIVLTESATICYGVTTVKDGKCAFHSWFSARDFHFVKVK